MMLPSKPFMEVAVKQFAPPVKWDAVRQEVCALEETSGRPYTLPFHGLYQAQMPVSKARTAEPAPESAFIVMG